MLGDKIGTFCGKTLPNEVLSASNKMFVKFSSEGSIVRKGFIASFSTKSKYFRATTFELII